VTGEERAISHGIIYTIRNPLQTFVSQYRETHTLQPKSFSAAWLSYCLSGAEEDRVMFFRGLMVSAALLYMTACTPDGPSSSETSGVVGPSGIADLPRTVAPGAPRAAAVGSENVIVNMHDNCDPGTFNAMLGAGTCVGRGGLTFDNFIAQLTRHGFVGSWHFAPKTVSAKRGERFLVVNRGGEEHTFTEVEEFGGGIVASLNELAHLPNVAPECLALGADDFVAPGQTFHEGIESDEEEKYQCCIHPWMRLSTRVSDTR
jgi:hypothetical protein